MKKLNWLRIILFSLTVIFIILASINIYNILHGHTEYLKLSAVCGWICGILWSMNNLIGK